MATSPERLAALEQRLTDHEVRCEERLGEIKVTAASTLRAVEGLKNRSWGLIVALLAWALAQLWSGNEARLQRLESPESASVGIPTGCRGVAPRPPLHLETST